MKFISTRDPKKVKYSLSEAVLKGLAPDGGLFFPLEIPQTSGNFSGKNYAEMAAEIFQKFSESEFSADQIRQMTHESYQDFEPAVVRISEKISILELFHGPTGAFKDFALQFLPRLLSAAIQREKAPDLLVLVATSGDTGGAALAGFSSVPHTACACFFPDGGVSPLQKAQMQTPTASNLFSAEIAGDFDGAQASLKAIFSDGDFAQAIFSEFGVCFSSANSINMGRLLPQIFYIFFALADKENAVDCIIPTGNFGDAFSAFLAKQMGAKVGKIIIVNNKNDTTARAIETGIFDIRERQTQKTISPAIDIRIPSNFERLLFWANGGNAEKILSWHQDLAQKGFFEMDAQTKKNIQAHFSAISVSDAETTAEIQQFFSEYEYLPDPHTAVALFAARKNATPALVFSTAHFAKFGATVFSALFPERELPDSETQILKEIEKVAKRPSINSHFFEVLARQKTQNATISAGTEAVKSAIWEFLKKQKETKIS